MIDNQQNMINNQQNIINNQKITSINLLYLLNST
jgi:hypothetical protein